ncbi:2725_t:CDS:2 [Entrophospora sp. SA101]|nr:2725_t:CDS:2 [Entrophospora sp. SA101]
MNWESYHRLQNQLQQLEMEILNWEIEITIRPSIPAHYIVHQACMAPLSPQDLFNIAKIEEGRDKQQIRNLNQITKHNAERALELQSLREDLNFFDWDQCFMEEKLNSNIFHPSFASHITDFDETTKCLACHSFPKCTARGLCKLCRFYVDNGLKSQIVDKNYQSKIEVLEKIDLETMCESALNGIFGFSDFCDGQKDAILSFAQNHDTLVLKQTGGGKSLCYALASVMTAGIIVVFSPLKALIDDQVLELINAGSQIVDKNYQSKIEVLEKIDLETMCESALNGIFGFSDFCDGQKDAILSFAQNHDTLVLKQTGGGKSLCYALASVMTAGIIVVFSPLKALIDDQVLELINAGVPCCGLYASTAQPVHYQQNDTLVLKQTGGGKKIVARLGINHQKILVICDKYFGNNSIIFQVQKRRDNKEQFLEDILRAINEVEVGKCIIYCASVKGCENLLSDLQDKVAKEIITMYHGELSAKEKSRDPMPEVCMVCDNCVRRMADNPSFVNVKSNMQKIQSQAKDIKNQFGHLPVYQEKFPRILKTKEDAFLLLDDLVLRKLVEEDIVLTRSSAGQTCVGSVSILGLTEDAFAKANNQNWIYLIK